jgi:ornithine cyclodeaminase/alanine dehydrogenase
VKKLAELLVLSENDLEKVLKMKDVISAVEEAFRGFALGEASMPGIVPMEVPKHNGFWAIKSALVNNQDIIGLKLSCGYFDNPKKYGLPSIMGVVIIADSRNGVPLAVLDGFQITAFRTGAIAGVAAKYLARKDSRVAAIFGAGTQGRTQLIALNEVLKLDEVHVYDILPALSRKYAQEMSGMLNLRVIAAESVQGALKGADVVSTATPSREPYIKYEWIERGTHITTVGSDEGSKQELESNIYDRSKVVVDKRDEALKKKYLRPQQIYAELGEIIVGKKVGRQSPEELTIMDSTGLGIQDLAAGYAAYKLAKEKNVGTRINFK